ncbi:MAG TPA: Lar family restriction alleviation protein [Rhizomicrobium sp.]|nr:Lar family restriction alleviation protein [Rhizomicrobium sp.]
MLEVIRQGAQDSAKRARPLPCPFCGTPPPLAAHVAGHFVVGCENEDCAANPQVSAASPGAAWEKWNDRPAR